MRRTIAVGALVVLVVSTGCLGFLTGSEPASFSADPTAVSESTVQESGYERTAGPTARTVERNFSAAGETRTVEVTNYLTEYRKTVDTGILGSTDAAVFAVISTPEVEVLEQTFNPVGDMNESQIAEMAQSKYDSFSVGEQVGSTSVETLGTQTDVAKFAGEARVAAGTTVDVSVHVDKINHESDYLVVVAVYPQALSGEESNVLDLLRNLEHPA